MIIIYEYNPLKNILYHFKIDNMCLRINYSWLRSLKSKLERIISYPNESRIVDLIRPGSTLQLFGIIYTYGSLHFRVVQRHAMKLHEEIISSKPVPPSYLIQLVWNIFLLCPSHVLKTVIHIYI